MKLSIGKRLNCEVGSIEEASKIYQSARDKAADDGFGSRSFPDGKLKDGKTVYEISYNGRVWLGSLRSGERTLISEAAR